MRTKEEIMKTAAAAEKEGGSAYAKEQSFGMTVLEIFVDIRDQLVQLNQKIPVAKAPPPPSAPPPKVA